MRRTISVSICLSSALFASCGRPPPADRGVPGSVSADMVVTFNGPTGSCAISRPGSATTQSMPCLQVPAYVAKTLKLPRGSLFDLVTIPDVNVAEYSQVMSELKAEGYGLTPGVHVDFLTEPKTRRP